MMRNIAIYILLSLISLSISVLAGEMVLSQAADASVTSVQEAPTDIERFLFANPEGYYEIPEDDSGGSVDQVASEDPLDEVSIYVPQLDSSIVYYDGSIGSNWIDAQVIEGFTDGMRLPVSDEIVGYDCRCLLDRIAKISPEKTSRANVSKAFYVMAEKGSDQEDCQRVLGFASWSVRGDVRSSADALGRSSLNLQGSDKAAESIPEQDMLQGRAVDWPRIFS